MKKKTKLRIAMTLVIAISGVVMLNVLAYNHAWAMTHFTDGGARTVKPEELTLGNKIKVLLSGINIPRPCGEQHASDVAADCRTVMIGSSDNTTLEAWYCDRGEATPLVILFHGYSADKTALIKEARAFLDLGASVMLVDFRGSGGSSESYTTIGVREAEDVAAAVQFSKEKQQHSNIILFGQSMGAAAILRAIRNDQINPDAIILEAVFDTMLNTVKNRFRTMHIPSFPGAQLLVFWGGRQWGFNGFKHNPADYAASVHCPALIMHGEDDPRAEIADGRRVFDVIPAPKTWVQFKNTGHEPYLATRPEEWRAAVKKIINRK
jgi:pimeloyl-ACP methyl ester carboxylesterase